LNKFSAYYVEYSKNAPDNILSVKPDMDFLLRFHSVVSPEAKNMFEVAKIFDSVAKRPDKNLMRGLLSRYSSDKTLLVIKEVLNDIREKEELNLDMLKEIMKEAVDRLSSRISSKKEIYHPLRIVLTGHVTGLEIISIIYILGIKETISRLSDAIDYLAG
jgi:glutamyl/glutaminyl-tRNA synthetase